MFGFLKFSLINIFVAKNEVSAFFFGDASDFSFYKVHAHPFGLLVELFKSLTKRADIDVINGYIGHWQSAHKQLRLLDGIHATNLRTDGITH